MGCPCRKRPNTNENGTLDVFTNGGTDVVTLGLKESIRLPIMFTAAFNNMNVVVLESRKLPPLNNSITLYGHNSPVEKRVRDTLVEGWAGMFEVEEETPLEPA